MKVVVINGMARAGKDTFVQLCQKHIFWCYNISTVDFVKEVAKFCGWNGEKTSRDRAFLSDLKDLLTEWRDVPYSKVVHEIELCKARVKSNDSSLNELVVFIHCREPEEISRFEVDYDAITLFISREEAEKEQASNHADANVRHFMYDCTIENNGTIEELEEKAIQFIHEWLDM